MKKGFVCVLAMLLLMGRETWCSAENGKADALFQESITLFSQGKYAQAKDKFEELIAYKQYSGNIEAHFDLGMIYYLLKIYDKAITEFTKVVEIDNNSNLPYYYLGMLYEAKLLHEKDESKALEIKNKAIGSWSTFIQKGNDLDLKYLTTAQKHLKRLTEEGQNEQR